MPLLANPDELAAYLQTSFEPEEEPQATLALELATADVIDRIGRDLLQVEDDVVTLDADGCGPLFLPATPVTAVTSVVVDGTELDVDEDIDWKRNGLLYRRNDASWGTKRNSVVVTYTHGLAAWPDTVKGVGLARAARIMENPALAAAETVGPQQTNYFASVVTETFTDGEKAILDRHRLIVVG